MWNTNPSDPRSWPASCGTQSLQKESDQQIKSTNQPPRPHTDNYPIKRSGMSLLKVGGCLLSETHPPTLSKQQRRVADTHTFLWVYDTHTTSVNLCTPLRERRKGACLNRQPVCGCVSTVDTSVRASPRCKRHDREQTHTDTHTESTKTHTNVCDLRTRIAEMGEPIV